MMGAKKFFVLCAISIISMANCEVNKPSRYIYEGGRILMYEATKFVFTIPPGTGSKSYRFDVFVNGVFSSSKDFTLNESQDINQRPHGVIWGEDLDDYAFGQKINFRVEVIEQQSEILIDYISIRLQLTKGIPSHIQNIIGRDKRIDADFKFLVRCDRFTGINCFLPTSIFNDQVVKINHFTGEQFCRNGKVDPPGCFEDPLPPPGVGDCLNGGTFIESSLIGSYCDCLKGFRGELCEKFSCDASCRKPKGACTGPNTCTCFPRFYGATCQIPTCDNFESCGNGVCSTFSGFAECICDEKFFGNRCQYTCNPSCEHGICILNADGISRCQCENGFKGESCDTEIVEELVFTDPDTTRSTATVILIGTLAITTGICLLCLLIQFEWSTKKKNELLKDLRNPNGKIFGQNDYFPTIYSGNREITSRENNPNFNPHFSIEDEVEAIYDELDIV